VREREEEKGGGGRGSALAVQSYNRIKYIFFFKGISKYSQLDQGYLLNYNASQVGNISRPSLRDFTFTNGVFGTSKSR